MMVILAFLEFCGKEWLCDFGMSFHMSDAVTDVRHGGLVLLEQVGESRFWALTIFNYHFGI